MINLDKAVVYDIECFPNYWSLYVEELHSNVNALFQICPWLDNRALLIQWFNYLSGAKIPMIGFNSVNYDYEMMHAIWTNPQITIQELYNKSQSIVNAAYGAPRRNVWENQRFAPQIDLFKVHHFDNKAKLTSLKALQINMRSNIVLESKIPFDKPITQFQAETIVIPYNIHDVQETKAFAHHSLEALKFRQELMTQIDGDVMNFSDTKIGGKILEKELGDNLCYDFVPKFPGDNNPKKVPRQTIRHRIALGEIVFPYIVFQNPEFQRVLTWIKQQVLTPDDLDDPDAEIKTKGVFTGLSAVVGGIEFKFGTGGIHASVISKRFVADNDWLLRDIDVKGLYPDIAIKNRLAPEHLGQPFVEEYAQLPIRRAKYQEQFGKKSTRANSMKLAGNGTYGNSNNKYSVFYDPKFTMTITINGQLLLCMLAEWLLTVPTLQIIQVNTDGITYRIHKSFEPQAVQICKTWEKYTTLTLEDTNYSHMWIRDVNSYIARDLKTGALKQKGAYWHPGDGADYAKSISEAQPPAWHKDLSNMVSIKAAVAAMTRSIPAEQFIRFHTDPFDFMCRVKVDRSSTLLLNGIEQQRASRYYVATNGHDMIKRSPPAKGAIVGTYKKKNGITDAEFNAIAATLAPGVHDERIHTKNKSTNIVRVTGIEAGWKVMECNDVSNFRFDNLNYNYYISEAMKLIVN